MSEREITDCLKIIDDYIVAGSSRGVKGTCERLKKIAPENTLKPLLYDSLHLCVDRLNSQNYQEMSEILEILLSFGACGNYTGGSNLTPILKVLKKRDLDTVEMFHVCQALIITGEAHKTIDFKDPSGHTALHWASKLKSTSLVYLFYSCKATLDARNNWEETPLYLSVFETDITTCNLLISKGANVNVKDNQGKYLIELSVEGILTTKTGTARKQDAVKVAALLIQSGASIGEELKCRGKSVKEVLQSEGLLELTC